MDEKIALSCRDLNSTSLPDTGISSYIIYSTWAVSGWPGVAQAFWRITAATGPLLSLSLPVLVPEVVPEGVTGDCSLQKQTLQPASHHLIT